MTNKEQYEICKQRNHQKSGSVTYIGTDRYEICKFCGTYFRFMTKIEEANAPA